MQRRIPQEVSGRVRLVPAHGRLCRVRQGGEHYPGQMVGASTQKVCGCHASAFTNFVRPPNSAQVGRVYCDQLFEAEKKIELLPAKERQRVQLEVETPMLKAFGCWVEKLAEQPLAGKLKTAVEYARSSVRVWRIT